MELVLNDLAFNYKLNNTNQIFEAADKFIDLIIILQKSRKEIQLIYDKEVNSIELMTGYSFQKLYNDKNIRKDKKTVLLRLFTKIKKINTNEEEKFVFDGIDSSLCGWAFFNRNILISLTTSEKFNKPFLSGIIMQISQFEEAKVPNIAEATHIEFHKLLLDLRVYEPNPKHKIGSNWGSPMDLDDTTSQVILDEAIVYNDEMKCLVNVYNNNYYVFRRHHSNCYHGYIDNEIPENIKNKLKKVAKA